jgi:hypothetical protein
MPNDNGWPGARAPTDAAHAIVEWRRLPIGDCRLNKKNHETVWNKTSRENLEQKHQGRTTMKLATIALASAFALSSTLALAYTSHHKHRSGARTHQGTVGMSYARTPVRSTNYGWNGGGWNGGWNGGAGGSNNRGGLVGGSDSGTYRP